MPRHRDRSWRPDSRPARWGIGPDFDDAKSAKENFIVGEGSALHAAGKAVEPSKIEQNHYVIDHVNDLEEMVKAGRFDKEKYRVWFIGPCTSVDFFDELRAASCRQPSTARTST